MIEAVQLTKTFGDFTAVKDVSFNVGSGKVMALLGHNGAGKTTTTRMLTATLAPTFGYARIAGYDTVKNPQEVRKTIGHLTELPGLYNRMRIEEYLDFFGEVYYVPKNIRKGRAEEMLKQFDLWETRQLKMGEYSKGMRQKAALIRALIHEPKVLFLDEPTSAMDPHSAKMVRDAISQLKQENRAIILCTHNLFEAEALADYITIIRKGEIVIEGTSEQLKRKLLGTPAYTVQLAQAIPTDGLPFELANLVELTQFGTDWFNFTTEEADKVNPILLRRLLDNGFEVVTISQVSRSLESVYLKIAGTPQQNSDSRDEIENSLNKVKKSGKGSSERDQQNQEQVSTEAEEVIR